MTQQNSNKACWYNFHFCLKLFFNFNGFTSSGYYSLKFILVRKLLSTHIKISFADTSKIFNYIHTWRSHISQSFFSNLNFTSHLTDERATRAGGLLYKNVIFLWNKSFLFRKSILNRRDKLYEYETHLIEI